MVGPGRTGLDRAGRARLRREGHQQALEKSRAFLTRELVEKPLPRTLLRCTSDTFRPRTRYAVRWLNPYEDYDLARTYWNLKPDNDLSREHWLEAHQMGYSYAAWWNKPIRALAAVLRYSEAAGSCQPSRPTTPRTAAGLWKSVCSFLTQYILGAGKIATLSTGAENLPMQKTVEGTRCIGGCGGGVRGEEPHLPRSFSWTARQYGFLWTIPLAQIQEKEGQNRPELWVGA